MDMASKGNATVHYIYLFPCLETKVYINCLDEFTCWINSSFEREKVNSPLYLLH